MKTISNSVVLAFILLGGFLATAQSIETVRKNISYGQIAKATSEMEVVVKANASNIQYHLLLGDLYARNEEFDKALETWRLAAAINPIDNYGLIAAGRVQLPINATEAQKLFDRAIKNTKSRDAKILHVVGESFLYTKSSNPDLAIDYFNKALAIDRSDAAVFMSLAEAFLHKRDFGSAVTNYDYAADKSSNKAEAYFKMGEMYIRAKNFSLGKDFLERARQADVNFPSVYKVLGDYYYETAGDFSAAVESYKKYMTLVEPTKDDQARYANALHAAGKYEESIGTINEILKKDPSSYYLYKVISESYRQLQQAEKGLEYMMKYVAVIPADKVEASDYLTIANLYKSKGGDSLALLNYDKALQLDSNLSDALDSVLTLLNGQKRYKESIKYHRMKTALPTAGAMDFFNLGRAHYISMDFAAADSAFRKIIELRPEAATGYLWSAKSSAKLDPELETGVAVPMYEQFIQVALPNRDTFKKELSEAYGYLAYYHYVRMEDMLKAKEMAQKAVEVDPTNEQAGEMLKALQ
jgi:tetratricopeptide (TPR) repeat protein